MSQVKRTTGDTKVFLDFLKKITPIPQEFCDQITKHAFPLSFRKNKFIGPDVVQPPSVYFIVKGLARGFIKDEGRDITTWLAKEGELIGKLNQKDTESFDCETMQALESIEVLALPYTLINDLYEKFPETKILGLSILSRQYERAKEAALLARIPSAEQRYHRFIRLSGAMINRLSIKCIASYLGIRMETLSRIRSKGRKIFLESLDHISA